MKKRLVAFLLAVSILLTMSTGISFAISGIDFSNSPPIACGQEKSLTMDMDSELCIYKFTPDETGVYCFYSYNSDFDEYNYAICNIFDSNEEYIYCYYNWDSNDDFRAQCNMSAGETYYLVVAVNSIEEESFSVKLVKLVTPAQSMEIRGGDSYSGYTSDWLTLNVDFKPEDAIVENVTWTSSDESVVYVDEYGYAILGMPGNATITATSENGLEASCSIEVKEPVSILCDEEKTLSTAVDSGVCLYEFIPEEDGIYCFYSYNSDEHIDAAGEVYDSEFLDYTYDDDSGIGFDFRVQFTMTAGETYYLKASTWYSDEVGSYSVKVIKLDTPAQSIVLNNGEDFSGYVGDLAYLDAVFTPDEAIYEEISWESSDESVVYVDDMGYIELISLGTAVITVTSESGLTDSCVITVEELPDVIYGDADGDGTVNAVDAMTVLQYSVESIDEDAIDLIAADVDGSGEIDAIDAMLILQYDVEIIDIFPVEQ